MTIKILFLAARALNGNEPVRSQDGGLLEWASFLTANASALNREWSKREAEGGHFDVR